jgi:hypothetical protein
LTRRGKRAVTTGKFPSLGGLPDQVRGHQGTEAALDITGGRVDHECLRGHVASHHGLPSGRLEDRAEGSSTGTLGGLADRAVAVDAVLADHFGLAIIDRDRGTGAATRHAGHLGGLEGLGWIVGGGLVDLR